MATREKKYKLTKIKHSVEANSNFLPESSGLLLHMKRKSRKSGQTIEVDCKQTVEGFVVLKARGDTEVS